jgi:E3 ubiquitin-protein ligase UBR4
MKRSRSDLSIVIMQQLTQPLSEGIISFTVLSEDETDCTELIKKENLEFLMSINAGEILLKWAISIPTVTSNCNLKYENECFLLHAKSLHLPVTHSEAQNIKQNFKQMDVDITNILNILQLPIMEPLSLAKIQQLSQLSVSTLYCCILTSISSSILMMSSTSSTQLAQTKTPSNTSLTSGKEGNTIEDFNEDISRNIVDKSLEIFNIVREILKRSAKNYIYQNHVALGAWLLLTGIQGAMSASGGSQKSSSNLQIDDPAKTSKSPAKAQEPRVNLFKVQQSFGVLNAAIARQSIKLLEELLDDLKIELIGQDNEDGIQTTLSPELQNFSVLKHYSSLERVNCVFNSATLQQLLTFLATISYRKACNLRRLNTKNLSEAGGETLSYSDSTTYFIDTLSGSDDSETESEEDADDENDEDEEEEDSESYLGSWLKETLSPEASDDVPETNEPKEEKKASTNSVPVKDEPHEYLELSAQILIFLDQKLGDCKNKFLARHIKNGLSEQQMVLLANILKDLDRDSLLGLNVPAQDSQDTKCFQWQKTMVKFSSAIGKYMHNLISNQMLSENLQSLLLQNLGVSPWQTESNSWPLQVYSRALAILVQILLLKPPQEKEAACLSVWHRLVNTLVEGVCSTNAPPEDYEDLNVEHAQLLLFLFHSLNLMQKKYILLLTAGGVIRCAEVCRTICPDRPLRDNQLMLLSRLLLFLEYLMKHLYSAPNILLEQVRWNLFGIFTMDSEQKSSDLSNYKEKMSHFYRKEIEDKYRKACGADGQTIKPKFYSLTVVNSGKQEFKMDGLAWNFILCTPNKLKYPLLIDSLINVLNITDMSVGKVSFQTQCAVHYCFSLAWKLLLGLPPSTQHVENLMALEDKQVNLHTLLWSIRCLKPITHSHSLVVNSLIKQVRNFINFVEFQTNNFQIYFYREFTRKLLKPCGIH